MNATYIAQGELAGPLQTEILCLMWNPVFVGRKWTVRELQELVNKKRGGLNNKALAYTTILTVLRNLARRGFVNQISGNRAHDFTVKVTRTVYEHTVLSTLCTSLFAGSVDEMVQAVARLDTGDHA